MSEPPIPGEFGNMSGDIDLLVAAICGAAFGAAIVVMLAVGLYAAVHYG